jgi:hypothetical protein
MGAVLGHGKRLAAIAACLLSAAASLLGCGGSDPPGSGATAASGQGPSTRASSGPTEAILHPLGESGVSGKVVYVKQKSGFPLVKIRLRGLERATGETQYFMWQLGSRQNMVSPASYHVPHGGKLSVNLEPSPEGLSWLEDGTTTEFLVTKIANDDVYFVAREHSRTAGDPAMIGRPVARGAFTGALVGAAGGE